MVCASDLQALYYQQARFNIKEVIAKAPAKIFQKG
jgi:hypothetical protein